ncbi:phytanoyl-CoA dioxygenase [Metarhizium rileyi]|uniref:Protein N-terminal and lysine N-methyltransferase EFM7 n=1 Tax=Metarhizium rileyi (strain RCEF 4871) TaxID=1649241 RepID=A0A167KKP3_METRR|nr:phytanoyl-CoA dioxygenase [Metarhizium rileyi RCEF 4871]
MPRPRAEDWLHNGQDFRGRDGDTSKDYAVSRVRSHSPTRKRQVSKMDRRSASPDGESHRTHKSHSHHHHRRREHKRARRTLAAASVPATLPFSARALSKSEFHAFEPLFAYYLDLQKQKFLQDMDEREVRGRWKSFVGKWNRNELAEGWYDPEMFATCTAEYPRPDGHARRRERGDERHEQTLAGREATPPAGDSDDDDDDDGDYGPALPSSHPRRSAGARAATREDLSLRDELVAEQREAEREALRRARKADRAVQKERLEELVPRAEAGTRERKLEKKKDANDRMRQFRDKSPGMEAGDEGQLMGGGDELVEYKKMKEREQKRKSERQVQREEFERARREEMEAKRRAWQEREEGTRGLPRPCFRPPLAGVIYSAGQVTAMEQDDDYGTGGLMDDPEDYYPSSPKPTKQTFTMQSGRQVSLHLVGHSPTEAHHLWNGAKFISDYLEEDPARVEGKSVLELGAGAGLPSLVAGILGASKVVMTDFPDPDLVANMQKNIDECDATVEPEGHIRRTVDAVGFVWGADPEPLLARLGPGAAGTDEGRYQVDDGAAASGPHDGTQRRFDVLVLADLLFRHSEHGALVKTIKETMRASRESAAYVFFTSYRPWKRHLDMGFFDVARNAHLEVELVSERKLEEPLFEGDPGDLEVQKTVTGFVVRWRAEDCCN